MINIVGSCDRDTYTHGKLRGEANKYGPQKAEDPMNLYRGWITVSAKDGGS